MNSSGHPTTEQTEKPLSLTDALPAFASELQRLLTEAGEPELAAQVPSLRIFERCRCEDGLCCGTFYVRPRPNGAYGPNHRCLRLFPDEGSLLILDVVAGEIACVEVLDRPDMKNWREFLPERPSTHFVAKLVYC